jgi:hypothetical protein
LLSLTQLAKILCLPYYCLCLLFNKIRDKAEQVLPGSKGEGEEGGDREQRGEITQTMYAQGYK